jgi:hypothetical protein
VVASRRLDRFYRRGFMKKLITLLILCCGFLSFPALAKSIYCNGGKMLASGEIEIHCDNSIKTTINVQDLIDLRCYALKYRGDHRVSYSRAHYKKYCSNEKRVYRCTTYKIYGENVLTCSFTSSHPQCKEIFLTTCGNTPGFESSYQKNE